MPLNSRLFALPTGGENTNIVTAETQTPPIDHDPHTMTTREFMELLNEHYVTSTPGSR